MRCTLLTILILACAPALAEPSVAGGMPLDLHYERNRAWFEIRHFGTRWPHWSAALSVTGVTGDIYKSWRDGTFEAGLGIGFGSPDRNIGTNWWYTQRFEWRFTPQFSVGGLHESNCRGVCDNSLMRWMPRGTKSEANSGRNYGYLRWRF